MSKDYQSVCLFYDLHLTTLGQRCDIKMISVQAGKYMRDSKMILVDFGAIFRQIVMSGDEGFDWGQNFQTVTSNRQVFSPFHVKSY